MLHAQNPNKIVTEAGKLEIKKIDDIENWIILNDTTIIKKTEEPIVYVEHTYNLLNSTVLLLGADMGGSGTLTSYFVIELFKNGKYIISEDDEMYSADGKFSYSMKHGKLTVDLGYDSGTKKYAIYEKGKLHIKRVKQKKSPANEDDCNFLYNRIYIEFVDNRNCNEDPYEVGGMSTARSVYALENDPRLNLKPLVEMSRKACKGRNPILYSQFRKIICGAAKR
jgi:hypothetical protein